MCWNFSAKLSDKKAFDQNAEIWGQNWESIKALKDQCTMSIEQNVEILVQSIKSIKMMQFQGKKVEIYQNLEIWGLNWTLIKVMKFQCKVSNWPKCWNLSAKCQIDKNVAILVKK